jgi:hypothetical protein
LGINSECSQDWRPNEGQQDAQQDQQDANKTDPLAAAINRNEAPPAAPKAQREKRDWWHPFVCEVKATDLALAYFTLMLVIVGWFTLDRSERSTRKTERAYLAGGGDIQRSPAGQLQRDANNKRLFRMEIGNHGKTPAFLHAFDIHFCTLAKVQNGPRPVTQRYTHVDQFPPGEKHRWIGPLRPILCEKFDVIYGAFWYEDIWRRKFCSRFILRIENGRTHSNVTGVDPSYREWDWTEKKGKKKQT